MATTINWTPTLFEAKDGEFSSAKRYLRKAASGGFAMAAGETVSGLWVYVNASTRGVAWAARIGSVVDWSAPYAGSSATPPSPVVQAVEF